MVFIFPCVAKKTPITLGITLWGERESTEGVKFLSSGSLTACTKSAFTWKVWCWHLQVSSVPTVDVCSISSMVKGAGRALQKTALLLLKFRFWSSSALRAQSGLAQIKCHEALQIFLCVGEKWGRKTTLFCRLFYRCHFVTQRKTVRLRNFFYLLWNLMIFFIVSWWRKIWTFVFVFPFSHGKEIPIQNVDIFDQNKAFW